MHIAQAADYRGLTKIGIQLADIDVEVAGGSPLPPGALPRLLAVLGRLLGHHEAIALAGDRAQVLMLVDDGEADALPPSNFVISTLALRCYT